MALKRKGLQIFVRSLSEGMWVFHDPELQRGKKHCVVMIGPHRLHPELMECINAYEPLVSSWATEHQIKVFMEDTPSGYLHEKYGCAPDQFHLYIFDRNGQLLMESDHFVPPEVAYAQLSGRSGAANYV